MGVYVYKVVNKIVTDSEGRNANLAVYAYKPWPWHWYDHYTGKTGDDLNRAAAAKSKCHLADRYVRVSKNYTGRVVMEEGGVSIEYNAGTLTDAWFYREISELKKAA